MTRPSPPPPSPPPPPPRTTADLEPARSRVSWGAILAGAVMALIVTIVLQLVMLWIGALAIDPAEDVRPFEGVGTAVAFGFIVTSALALFAGGLVAGRFANRVNSTDVFLHGLLTWAVVTVASLWFAVGAVGALFTGAAGIVGQGLGLIGEGAAAVAPAVAQRLEDALEEQRLVLEEFRDEMEPLWTEPAARREFRAVVSRIERDPSPTVAEEDRQELIDVVATHTELSEAEAEERVDAWIEAYEEGQEVLAQVEEELRLAGQAAADAIAEAAGWSVLALAVGAVIAMLGARAGAPGSRRETETA